MSKMVIILENKLSKEEGEADPFYWPKKGEYSFLANSCVSLLEKIF